LGHFAANDRLLSWRLREFLFHIFDRRLKQSNFLVFVMLGLLQFIDLLLVLLQTVFHILDPLILELNLLDQIVILLNKELLLELLVGEALSHLVELLLILLDILLLLQDLILVLVVLVVLIGIFASLFVCALNLYNQLLFCCVLHWF